MTTQAAVPKPSSRTATPSALLALLLASLLVLELVVSSLTVQFSPPGTNISPFWPAAGISVLLLSLAVPSWRPGLYCAIFVVTSLGNLVGGRPLDVSLALGLANVTEAGVAMAVLLRGGRVRPRLATLEDFARFIVAVLAAALTAAVIAGIGVAWLDDGSFVVTARTLLAAHIAAILLIAPLGMQMPRRGGGPVPWWEMAAQWGLLLGAAAVIFSPGQDLALGALLFPPLVWGAMRLGPRQTAIQLLAFSVVISMLTMGGHGPFYAAVQAGDFAPEMTGSLLQASLLAAALVTLPLSLLRAEQALMLDRLTQSYELVSNIMKATTATGILGISKNGRIEFFNVGAEQLARYNAVEVVGRSYLHPVTSPEGKPRLVIREGRGAPGDPARLAPLLTPLLGTETDAVTSDWELVRADGHVRTVSLSVSKRFGDDGELIGYLGVAEDVTVRRQQEALLQAALESEREVSERLAQVDQAKNQFLTTVSHELRTPITSVMGYAELLLNDDSGALPALHQQILGRIERNGRRLMQLVDDMLTIAQMEVGDLAFTKVPIDLRQPVQAAADEVKLTFGAADLSLDCTLPDEPVPVLGDAAQLIRVFANLLGNAAKFSDFGEAVTLRLSAEDDRAVVSVTDNGVGISPQDQSRLFDRFFRGSNTDARAIQGAGLGLTIASAIVDGHDGQITVQSQPGQGSTFVVRLPLHAEEAQSS